MSNSLIKQALSTLTQESRRMSRWVIPTYGVQAVPRSATRHHQWLKWLLPGLFVKRWLLLSTGGVVLTMLGIAVWANLSPVYYIIRFIRDALQWATTIVPNQISGPIVIVVGLLFVFWGHTRTLGAITEVLMPEGDDELVDVLLAHRRLNRGPKIVTIGGGTGLSTLLRGLKEYSANITAIVTVADDGGSSGRLRREIGVLPPGDIRNCLAALADEENLVTELFQYRFRAGDGLTGHSFGNLFLTAMTEVTGDLERAIAASSEVLAVRGRVLPATISDVRLWAELADGQVIEGESNITAAKGSIRRIGCTPPDPPALPTVLQAIHEADYIVIGPGSLYTSIIPNLLVPDIVTAIAARPVPRIYVCNIMTEPGETQDYSVSDHIQAIDAACGYRLFDAVLVQRRSPLPETIARYAQSGAQPVHLDRDQVQRLGRRIILANIMHEDETNGLVRHDPKLLGRVLFRWYSRINGL